LSIARAARVAEVVFNPGVEVITARKS